MSEEIKKWKYKVRTIDDARFIGNRHVGIGHCRNCRNYVGHEVAI
jgi:hypothetical protein